MRAYKIEQRPQRDYAAYLSTYLATYGPVYGDMSDPLKRAEVIVMLRRRDGLTLASARREFWREVKAMSTEDIRDAIAVKTYQLDYCGDMRPWNIRNADIHEFRVLSRELKSREFEYLTVDSGKRVKVQRVKPSQLRPGDRVFYDSHPDRYVTVDMRTHHTEPSKLNPGERVAYVNIYADWTGYNDVQPWKVRADGGTFLRII